MHFRVKLCQRAEEAGVRAGQRLGTRKGAPSRGRRRGALSSARRPERPGAMRFNERELLSLSRQPAEKAAEVLMRAPKKGSVLKKRLVKLVVNFLFYFRTDEAEPIGALLLEHCRIHQEENNVFSIGFLEEPDRKYYFECDTAEQCQEWVEVLKRASYEFMRTSLIFYRNEIQRMTGKDPLEQYGISEEARFQLGAGKL